MSILKRFSIPSRLPKDSDSQLWQLQLLLDEYAQQIFGPRNPDKQLYQPTFSSNPAEQPCVINTISGDGGFAQLSVNASTYWPTTVYELAHETVHLLDPRPAPPVGKGSNWLEEGVAVEFSLHCAGIIFGKVPTVNSPKYVTAKNITLKLGRQDLFEKCKKIREECGHFADATYDAIKMHAPSCDETALRKLTTRFDTTSLINEQQ